MKHTPKYKFAIAGAGFSGAVLARELVTNLDCNVTIFEERSHIGGNCYTEKDEKTSIEIHKYGPHIFNTNYNLVWEYVNKFCRMGTYIHQVKANTTKGIFSLPINLDTINKFFDKSFNPTEAEEFINTLGYKNITEPKNFEEFALKYIGKDLYETFIKYYSEKQWGCAMTELPASVIKRLPVRFNYNSNYHKSKFVGIPVEGYTGLIKNILNHDKITIVLNTKINRDVLGEFNHLFYCGPIDKFYEYKFGNLGYRTVYWENNYAKGDFQGISQVNYTENNVPFTRIVEHKHFTPWNDFNETFYSIEYSKETTVNDIPYYPKRLEKDIEILSKYREFAENIEYNISFLGRLATYRYMDMDKTILEALNFAKLFISKINESKKPVFPNTEI
ncbi:MAG: UDP-galactopyranose mutase [Bacteroidia bacterium]